MWHTCRSAFVHRFAVILGMSAAGCGPAAPKVVLDSPPEVPATWRSKKLFHTPNAYIYARDELAAGEADRWVREVHDYVARGYKGNLDKGVVLVMEPDDSPVAATLEEQFALETDPTIRPTAPRKNRAVAEVRERMAKEGIPEGPTIRGSTLPLPPSKLEQLGLSVRARWAVAAPSHELAILCAEDVGAAAFRKQRPDLTEEQARKAAHAASGMLAKPFEIARPDPVFWLWAQRQKDWSDDKKRDAIRERIRHTYRSNWLPIPKDEDLDW